MSGTQYKSEIYLKSASPVLGGDVVVREADSSDPSFLRFSIRRFGSKFPYGCSYLAPLIEVFARIKLKKIIIKHI